LELAVSLAGRKRRGLAMKHCTQCKTELPDEARFCMICGAAQEAVPGTSARAQHDGAVDQEKGMVAGARGVAIGGSVRSSVIITSDGSVVRRSKGR
jgi:hypothetical protein